MTNTRILLWLPFVLLSCALLSNAQEPKILTMDTLKTIRSSIDNFYYFVIVNSNIKGQLMKEIESMPSLQQNSKIKWFYSNCKDEILVACGKKENIPVIVFHNKGVIYYSRYSDSLLHNVEDITQWMESIVSAYPVHVQSAEQIEKILQANREVFVLWADKKKYEEPTAYELLSKEFPYIRFIYIQDDSIGEELNLTMGNLTYYNESLSQENRRIYSHSPRIDIWKQFVFECYASHIKNIDNSLPTNRFPLKPFKGLLILWDNSVKCWDFWEQLMNLRDEQNLNEKMGLSDDISLMKFFIRQESIKLIQLLQIYYHVKLGKNIEYPLLLYIDNGDEKAKMPTKFIYSLTRKESITREISQFIKSIENNSIQPYSLDSGIPKKNGFYGKGSEKLIQKLTYSIYRSSINEANSKNKHYIVLITAFDFDCQKCSQFYVEYKKLASYMNAQRDDLVFGVMDLSTNQVDQPLIHNIPDVLLYQGKTGKVVRSLKRFSFEGIMEFIQQNAPKLQQNNDL